MRYNNDLTFVIHTNLLTKVRYHSKIIYYKKQLHEKAKIKIIYLVKNRLFTNV